MDYAPVKPSPLPAPPTCPIEIKKKNISPLVILTEILLRSIVTELMCVFWTDCVVIELLIFQWIEQNSIFLVKMNFEFHWFKEDNVIRT